MPPPCLSCSRPPPRPLLGPGTRYRGLCRVFVAGLPFVFLTRLRSHESRECVFTRCKALLLAKGSAVCLHVRVCFTQTQPARLQLSCCRFIWRVLSGWASGTEIRLSSRVGRPYSSSPSVATCCNDLRTTRGPSATCGW